MGTKSKEKGDRSYGGESAERRMADRRERLLSAGIELLGTPVEEGGGITVRSVCERASLTSRYFYESFEAPSELAIAAFEAVVDGAAAAVAASLAAAPPEANARSRATVEAFVAYAVDNPRRAHILFSEGAASEVLREQRSRALRTFAQLAAAQSREIYGTHPGNEELVETASYLIAGGMGELLLAWSRGELSSSREQLIDDAVDLLGAIGGAAAKLAVERGGSE